MCRQSATVCLTKSPPRQHRSLPSLAERLGTLPDPRKRRGVRHPFVAVLLIAACAVTAGARSWTAIGQWARSAPHTPWPVSAPAPSVPSLSARLPHRPPSGA
ncbi:transposase family protein [Streptomyces fulvoviolaceus]|uniref:transposase family protein n=1 Tax=Streptomyces fulvoviolaceus TaxID=285535 RepID=UPI003B830F72